jgi:ABC-type phosphate transport system substrate-binding protein
MSLPLPELHAPRRPSTPTLRRTLAITISLGAALAFAACTVLVNRSTVQCRTDGDCARYGNHPFCQNNVCVPSGLEPNGCFLATPEAGPEQPTDFLNQCSSTAACIPFTDCKSIGICGNDAWDASNVLPPEAAAAAPAPTPTATPDVDAADASDDASAPPQMPSCLDPNNGRPNVIYMTGSSNFPPLLVKLAPLIVSSATMPGFTPVFQVSNSCSGVAAVFKGNTISDPTPGPSAKYAQYVGADMALHNCTLGPTPVQVDVGESDIFSTTCDSTEVPDTSTSTVHEILGAIQAMVFVVPGLSMETSISAQYARAVFGMGGDNGLAKPWTNPMLYFVRNASTGTQQMIGKAIGVPPSQFWGVDRGSAASVAAQMQIITDPATAETAIGIISADYYDENRKNLNALAFQANGQDCAYLPDSTSLVTDKQNVRDGHYGIWGPLHFFVGINASGVPVSPGAVAFANVMSVPKEPKTLIDAFIQSSLVPTCAMKVQRSLELGPLSSYSPPYQCYCYFEGSVSMANASNVAPPPGCTRCTTQTDCTDPTRPTCNLGYCEIE